jgi:hypothetical protein
MPLGARSRPSDERNDRYGGQVLAGKTLLILPAKPDDVVDHMLMSDVVYHESHLGTRILIAYYKTWR